MKKRVLSAMLVAAMAMTALPSQTFAEGALDAKLLWIGAGYLVVGVVVAFWHYSRKDIA